MDNLNTMNTLHRGPASDEDKKLRRREQNRLSAQRSYHKKQERLASLRSQVAQLQSTYERHVTTIPPASPNALLPIASAVSSPSSVSGECEGKSHHVSPSSPPQTSYQLQDLLSSRTQLQNENDALRRRIDDHTKFQFRLQSLGTSEDAGEDTGLTLVQNSVTGSPRFQPRVQMKRPLTVDECYSIGSNGYQFMKKYRFPDNYMTTGSSLFGWSDKRVMEDGLLKVKLTKIFYGHDIDTVSRTSWLGVQDPRRMDALYSLNMNMHSEIVQYIDENNTVMYQSYETPERDATGKETGAIVVMHHVMLLTMFASDNGYVIIFCSLEPDRLDDSDHIVDLAEEEEASARGRVKRRRKQWFKKFSWLVFNRVEDNPKDDAFEMTYVFTVPPHHGANFYWPLEIMLLILRFEMGVMGPMILLPSSSTDIEDDAKEEADDDSGVIMIENKAVKIEPLTHDIRSPPVDIGVVDDEMSELFTELFP